MTCHSDQMCAISTLTSDLGRTAPSSFRLLPAGLFRAKDGRPKDLPGWRLDSDDMQRIIADFESRETDIPIDYEHQIINARMNGQPAPAAGWIKRIEARMDGLWAVDVRWTDRAREMIEAGEYRYVSPVFEYDRKTGHVKRLLMAAITNNPALDGLTDLMPLKAYHIDSTLEDSMELEHEKALAAHLGMGDGDDIAEAALKRITELEDALAAKDREIEAIKSAAVPMSEHAKLQAELAALRAEMEAGERERLLEQGLSDGRILPAQREFWATQPLATLKEWLKIAQPIAALGDIQSSRVAQNADKVQLTDFDREAARLLGMTEDAFAAAKARQKNNLTCKE